MPEQFRRYGESWKRINPGWVMCEWQDGDLDGELINQECFDCAKHVCQKADILRYELLAVFGGVYIDTDFEALKPIEELLDGVEAFAAAEDSQYVSIGILGAEPGHPVFKDAIRQVKFRFHPDQPINETTGPHLMTEVVHRYPDRMKVFEPDLFYPIRHDKPYAEFSIAYAVHHWAAAWKNL